MACLNYYCLLGATVTTVAEELKHNPRLTKSREEFVEIMTNLGLVKPKKMGKIWRVQFLNVHIISAWPDSFLDFLKVRFRSVQSGGSTSLVTRSAP